jgi:hypothetical protein
MKRLLDEIPGREIVLQVGAEGGSLTIVRYHVSGEKWQFAIIRDESILVDFLGKEDNEDLFEALDSIATFEDAIALMNKYPWPNLYPLVVHPEYANRVMEIIERSGNPRAKDRWKDILGSEIPDSDFG